MSKKPYKWKMPPREDFFGLPKLIINFEMLGEGEILVETSGNLFVVEDKKFDDIDRAMDYAEQLAHNTLETEKQQLAYYDSLAVKVIERNRKSGRNNE